MDTDSDRAVLIRHHQLLKSATLVGMDVETLTEIISAGESFEVEFKSERRQQLHDESLLNAVVCLANGRGGCLLLGVEDDGTITGAHLRSPEQIASLIANKTSPTLATEVEEVILDGVPVIVVTVPPDVPLTATINGVYKRRALDSHGRPTCLTILPHDLAITRSNPSQQDFGTSPAPGASWNDLDPLEFDRLRRLIEESRGGDQSLVELSDEDIAAALGVVSSRDTTKMTVFMGALLLFGKEDSLRRLLPTHEAAFQVLDGTAVRVNDFFRWPLLRLAEEFLSRFRARNNEQETDLGLLRIALPDYSEVAFREALANALVHRDYTRLGAVHVQWSDEELAISSQGGFPEGVRLDNLLVTTPHPRNRVIADAFKRAALAERTGRGINRMFEQQLRFGRSAPEYSRSNESTVVAALPGEPANLAVTRFVLEQDRAYQSLKLPDLQLLNELTREREINTAEAAQLIQMSEEQAKRVLRRMTERGWIEPRGATQNRVYHLSATVYRQLGDSASYVRLKGFEPIRQEQMVLQLFQANDEVSSSDVAKLCQVNAWQARGLLARLVKENKVTRHGTGRWTRYRLKIRSRDD